MSYMPDNISDARVERAEMVLKFYGEDIWKLLADLHDYAAANMMDFTASKLAAFRLDEHGKAV